MILVAGWRERTLRRKRQLCQETIMSAPTKSPRRLLWMRVATVLIASCLAYVLAEIGFRVYRYHQLSQQCMNFVVLLKQADDSAVLKMAWHETSDFNEFSLKFHQAVLFDRELGYRLRPNMQFECQLPHLALRKWRTNSYGHIADEEYPVAKPANEFRIVTIGDSFTAGENNTIRWQSKLQERLNRNPDWQRFVGGKFTRVINLGMSGIGMGQFQAVFDVEGKRFEPDITLINFPVRDIQRRWYSIGQVETLEQAQEHIHKNILGRLPWYRIYPELLASTGLGKGLGLTSRLNAQYSRHYENDDEAIQVSSAAIAHIAQHSPRTLLFLHPTLGELENDRLLPEDVVLMANFEAAIAPVKVCAMRQVLPRVKKAGEEYGQWYQFPHDPHPSDRGQEAYAAALELVLVEDGLGRPSHAEKKMP